MPKKDYFTVTLDKRGGTNVVGFKLGGAVLRGKPIYSSGSTGLADSIEELLNEGLIHVPTYRLIAGRAFVGRDDEVWSEYHDSNAERITAFDEKGIMGVKGTVYALDIQNGGLFVWSPQRLREAVKSGELVDYALQLEQYEVNAVLDAIERSDTEALKQLVHGRNVTFIGNYSEFLEASASPDFIQGMDTTYLVIRPANEARQIESGCEDISAQRENPDLVIASGGKAPLERMLDQAEKCGLKAFGAGNDGYEHNNTGRVVCLSAGSYGVHDSRAMDYHGRPVGISLEALELFYK